MPGMFRVDVVGEVRGSARLRPPVDKPHGPVLSAALELNGEGAKMKSIALVGCRLAIVSVQAAALRVSLLSTDPVASCATWETAARVNPYGAREPHLGQARGAPAPIHTAPNHGSRAVPTTQRV
jgi:hypothetical protein